MRGLLFVLAIAGLAVALPGCGCGIDYATAADGGILNLQGTLVEKSDHTLIFEVGSGELVTVELAVGRTWPLREGSRYLVTAWEAADGTLQASMGGRCSEATIRHEDGSAIDTSYTAWVHDKLVLFVVWGGGGLAAVIALWGLTRWARQALEPID